MNELVYKILLPAIFSALDANKSQRPHYDTLWELNLVSDQYTLESIPWINSSVGRYMLCMWKILSSIIGISR